ncbi:hypothetical protein PVK06_008832 [Gossypium arboreum]|uniref:Uncharacterized protein n=1 Tax=Gossypium arboreum TaxID=29729 RepID=A0ABR0QM25_GOSAR|nr:hypothetical protein PVK06_008832 [Gossypium arboreum]
MLSRNIFRKILSAPCLHSLLFPKELLSDPKDDDEDEFKAAVTDTTIHPATVEQKNKETKGEEEKIESVNIGSDKEGDNMNQTSALQEPTTAPKTTAPILEQDRTINQLIDDLMKSDDDDDDDEVPINQLKWKQCYKHAARKSTRSNQSMFSLG